MEPASNTRKLFSVTLSLENFEETARDTGPERSLMIACYHYSNFEWLSLACGFLDLKGTIISQEFKNSSLDPIFKRLREQSGHELVPRERGIMRLYKVLRRKGRTALLVDLTVPPSQGAVAIDCFGLADKRHVGACVAARANGRSHRTRAHRTAAGRTLQAGISSKDRKHRWNDTSANRAGLLGFIRALRAQKPGALALDVQTLALPSGTSRATLPVLLQLLSAVRKHAGAGKAGAGDKAKL